MSSDDEVIQRVSVFLEVSATEVDTFVEKFERAICSEDHDDPSARCPVRWFIVTEQLDEAEASEWRGLLNE